MKDPVWITEARKYIGTAEIPGPKHNSNILNWLKNLKAWWSEDETPWCGTFVAHCMKTAGFDVPKYWMRAKEWATWGTAVSKPTLGCIVVFDRQGGGHVGFVVGFDEKGRLMVLGGNQGNKVSIAPFERKLVSEGGRVVAYRIPTGYLVPPDKMPLLASNGAALSSNEA